MEKIKLKKSKKIDYFHSPIKAVILKVKKKYYSRRINLILKLIIEFLLLLIIFFIFLFFKIKLKLKFLLKDISKTSEKKNININVSNLLKIIIIKFLYF